MSKAYRQCLVMNIAEELEAKGIAQKALSVEIMPCYKSLYIGYLSKLFQKNKLYITRTTPNCYWLFKEGKKKTFKNAYSLIAYLDNFITEQISWQDYYKTLSGEGLNIYFRQNAKERKIYYERWKANKYLKYTKGL